jgi:hydrogenase maturation protein HypF
MPPSPHAPQHHAIHVRGVVQGVGFRPFVYRLAQALELSGSVCNDGDGVAIHVQGAPQFTRRLRDEAPPLAHVESLTTTTLATTAQAHSFSILPSSRSGAVHTQVAPDTATCDDCLRELFDPGDRRHRHAFINCTQCGPRYTVTRALPYDRANTSMAGFVMCAACQQEYDDPLSRRFHAEPNACPACGPQLALLDMQGRNISGDAIAATLALLRGGAIVAIKGLGGFHLACDAQQQDAVARLRQRKQRDEKPFALMVANVASARAWVHVGQADATLLQASQRPIVLLPQRADAPALPGIAPGLRQLGVMLPSTPIQQLLFHEAAHRPAGLAWTAQPQALTLVMTSANPGGEPLVRDNSEALARLAGIADAVLLHNRDIVARCDDSVLRGGDVAAPGRAANFVRRARGWTPQPIKLARAGPSVLACGAWLKNTVCLTRGDEAFVSPHIGDLDNAASCSALEETVAHLCAVLDVKPTRVAHDLHPDFFSSRFAQTYAAAHGLPVMGVQHHHAHIAAVAAEHCVAAPLLGLALDGVGLGDDGKAWGGELMLVHGAHMQRLGHLRELALPGGDAAAREPWRMAASALFALGRAHEIDTRFAHQHAASAVAQILARGQRCPPSSSMGRWFDAAGALLGQRQRSSFEGQAAMELEALATACQPPAFDEALVRLTPDGGLDPLPLLARLADIGDAPAGAALFHHAMAAGLARWVALAAADSGVRQVALAGGCFLNALLSQLLTHRLRAMGLKVLHAMQVPPHDGAIALGQAWVAMHHEGD